jgi:hypothetical protein
VAANSLQIVATICGELYLAANNLIICGHYALAANDQISCSDFHENVLHKGLDLFKDCESS